MDNLVRQAKENGRTIRLGPDDAEAEIARLARLLRTTPEDLELRLVAGDEIHTSSAIYCLPLLERSVRRETA